MKKENTVISVKMSKEEAAKLSRAAEAHKESRSGYSRRVLLEATEKSISSRKEIMDILMEVSCDLRSMTAENYAEKIESFNRKGEEICRQLSSL